jgi:hypothetical protein
MKKIVLLITILLSTLTLSNTSFSQDKFPVTEGPYLGQKTPGSIPIPFAPGIVSTKGYEYNGVFTPDMSEFYFIKGEKEGRKQNFVVYKKNGNKWHGSIMSNRLGQPTFSPDGKMMHLGRRYLVRTNGEWSERKVRDAPFSDLLIMRLTSSARGTYYFDTYDESNDSFPIRYSRIVDGNYEPPKTLDKVINTGSYLNHPFIAPDESYIIWDAKREEGYGDSDLYISYRQRDGSWGEAINLGDKINTDSWDAAGYVTPDGKYFFFNRTINAGPEDGLPDVDIYWVDATFIEDLRPKK